MLITGHHMRGKQACQELRFEEYIWKHHESWLEFARRHGHKVRLPDLMLVYGCHMTVDFAMFTFSDVVGEAQMGLEAGFPGIASVAVAISQNAAQRVSPAVNCGPWEQSSSSSAGVSVVEGAPAMENPSDNFKQCVILKRYRIERRRWLGPKVIKASARPHDLGSGNRFDGDETEVRVEGGDMEMVSDTMRVRKRGYRRWSSQSARQTVDPTDPLLEYILSVSLHFPNGPVSMSDKITY